ncbi:hypothetical protein V9T40_005982 [Parthenolecanium corni]|uniref:Uncharacterized protein n=1 Tax=Parthenolecanium corni TaxID=536013 RepID=A0AAN9TV47_9HEMI
MGGVPKFYGHDPPIAALLVLGMIVRESSFREGKQSQGYRLGGTPGIRLALVRFQGWSSYGRLRMKTLPPPPEEGWRKAPPVRTESSAPEALARHAC